MTAEAKPEFTFEQSFEAKIRDIQPAGSLGGGNLPVAIFERNGADVWCSLPRGEFTPGQDILITPVTHHDNNSGGSITTWDIVAKSEQAQPPEQEDLIQRHREFLQTRTH